MAVMSITSNRALRCLAAIKIKTEAPVPTSMVMSTPSTFTVTSTGFTRLLYNVYVDSLGEWSASESVIWYARFGVSLRFFLRVVQVLLRVSFCTGPLLEQ